MRARRKKKTTHVEIARFVVTGAEGKKVILRAEAEIGARAVRFYDLGPSSDTPCATADLSQAHLYVDLDFRQDSEGRLAPAAELLCGIALGMYSAFRQLAESGQEGRVHAE